MRRLVAGAAGVVILCACGMVQRAAAVRPLSFSEVRADLTACESRETPAVCEEKTRAHLKTPRSPDEEGELRYFLLRFLAKQAKHDRVLALLESLPPKASYLREARRLGAEAAFALGDHDRALDLAFLVYLSLAPAEKARMARVVFLSYLYKNDIAKAALWYSKLSEEKRALARNDMTVFFGTRPEAKQAFDAEIARLEAPPEPAPEAAPTAEAAPEATAEPAPAAEALPGMAPPEAPSFDEAYRPNWDRVCLFLSDEEKWRKVNEVVEVFFAWHLKEYAKSGVEIVTLRYLSAEELPALFAEARAQGCFAGIGPLFTDIAADEFARLSLSTPLPLFSYTPWAGEEVGLLFNFKYVKEQEAAEIAAWLATREKRRIAIAYPDDLKGRRLRDLYWAAVEGAGGTVSDALAFGPGDKSLLDDVDAMLALPEGYNSTLYRFRQDNADRYATPTLMKRALERLAKMTPMQADFDALVVLGSPDQAAMLLPAFPYKNVEFDYYSASEKNRVRTNQKKLQDDFGLSWPINTILVVVPSEAKGDVSFEKRMDKLIDGAAVAAPWQDLGEKNAAWKAFLEAFAAKFQRQPYAVEQPLAEMAAFVAAAREKGGKGAIGAFLSWVEEAPFDSLLANRPLRFTVPGRRLSGLGEVFVGVKTKGFQPARELFKEEDKDKDKEKGTQEETKEKEATAP